MLSNHPHTEVFLGSAIQNNAQPNTAEHYLSVCAQLYATTMFKQTVTVTYMTELLGRVPTIPIPIFNGIQKFRLASSSIQVFIQMILGHSDLILKNLVKGHIELSYATI